MTLLASALALPRARAPPNGTAYPHEAVYKVQGADALDIDALRRAIAVEAGDPLAGATVTVEPGEDSSFHLRIQAADLAYLRAATNSYLRWLSAAQATLNAAEPAKPAGK